MSATEDETPAPLVELVEARVAGPSQDRHFLGDFPANRPRAASASLTSPTETPDLAPEPLVELVETRDAAPAPAPLVELVEARVAAPAPAPLVELVETRVSGPLSGLRVAVTRSADRAGALADALAAAGAEPVLVPLIDFETVDQAPLGAALSRLAAGEYRWLVISSITTVRALKQWCEGAGTTLATLIPAQTKVATIGPTSMAVLAAEGIETALAPVDVQSGAGLVELWPEMAQSIADTGSLVLLPQAEVASPTLVAGIRAKGWSPEVTVAYRTVDYPAAPGKRLSTVLAHSATAYPVSNYPVLLPVQAAEEIQTQRIDAVVLASGSAARRVAATMAPLPRSCLVVAIGQPTRTEAQRLGVHVSATAAHPTPEGIVAALTAARTKFHTEH